VVANNKTNVDKALKALKDRNIYAEYVDNADQAREKVSSMVSNSSTVGIGGSITVQELDLENLLLNKDCIVFWHWHGTNQEEQDAIRRKAMTADFYICSSNALTLDGKLVNIDGTGNRVGAMVFGPRRVLIIVGVNKLTENLDTAMERIKTKACPPNARRLNKNTPCAETDQCPDCSSPHRMCNVTTIIEGKPGSIDLNVLIVGEELGY